MYWEGVVEKVQGKLSRGRWLLPHMSYNGRDHHSIHTLAQVKVHWTTSWSSAESAGHNGRLLLGQVALDPTMHALLAKVSTECPFSQQPETVAHCFLDCQRLCPLFNMTVIWCEGRKILFLVQDIKGRCKKMATVQRNKGRKVQEKGEQNCPLTKTGESSRGSLRLVKSVWDW